MNTVNELIKNIKKQKHDLIVVAATELPEKIKVNGKDRPTRNSSNNFIHATLEGIENFWKWFGDSKIVDGYGRPLLMFHGSPENDIEEFSGGHTAFGIFFTPDIETARFYTGDDTEDSKIYHAYLKAIKHVDLDDPHDFRKLANEVLDDATLNTRDLTEVKQISKDFFLKYYKNNEIIQKAIVEEIKRSFNANNLEIDVNAVPFSEESYPSKQAFTDDVDYLFNELFDESDADEFLQLVAKQSEKVRAWYEDTFRVTGYDDVENAYGTQEFYIEYQDDFMRAAQNLGHDCVVFTDPSSTGSSISYVVFNPSQIKSANENDGSFSENTSKINE